MASLMAPLHEEEDLLDVNQVKVTVDNENFFDAIRKGTPLTCPAQTAFETAVTVKNVNKALASRSRYEFKPSDFVA